MTKILPEKILAIMDPRDRKKLGKAGVTASEAQVKADHRAEIQIHNQIKWWLTRNCIRYLYASPNKRSTLPVGYPDFTIIANSRVLFVEVKTEIGKLTDEQRDWQSYLISSGHGHYVVRSYTEAISLIESESTSIYDNYEIKL